MQRPRRFVWIAACLVAACWASRLAAVPFAQSDDPNAAAARDLSPYDSLDGIQTLYQPFLVNLAPYEPLYFLMGADPKDSKFQLSFKYRFFNPEEGLGRVHPWVSHLHLGYTQTSYWDLKSDSQPFEDTSYKPELFYLTDRLAGDADRAGSLFLQFGFQHESNGRGESASRSTNFAYIKPMWVLHDPDSDLGLVVAPKIWLYAINDNETNRDLDAYRGYFDVQVKAGKARGLVVDSHLRWASQGGSVEVNLTYPLDKILSHNPDFFLHVQYVDALAESLLHYRDRTRAWRIGLAIVR